MIPNEQQLMRIASELAVADDLFVTGVLAAATNEMRDVRPLQRHPRELHEIQFKAAPTDAVWLEQAGMLTRFRVRLRRAIT